MSITSKDSIPIEALALIDYAERHGLLIAPGSSYDDEDGDSLNPDFLYTAEEARADLHGNKGNSFLDANRYDLWRLIQPNDVLAKLEQDYSIAKSYLEDFQKRIAALNTGAEESC